jgi:RsiW-degrading membrane proteinase PrsW (M82 family)
MDRSNAIAYVASMLVTTMVYLGVDYYQNHNGSAQDKSKVIAYALTGAFIAVSMYQLGNIWNSARNVNDMVS